MQEKKQTLAETRNRALRSLVIYTGVVLLIFAIFVPFLRTGKFSEERASVMGTGEVSASSVSEDQAVGQNSAPDPEAAATGDNNPVPMTPEYGVGSAETKILAPDPGFASQPAVAKVDPKKMVWPLKGKLLKTYGMVYSPTYSDYRFHQGIDIQADMGSKVVAVLSGKVLEVTTDQFEGTRIIIDHGEGWQGIYAQLAESYVQAGELVKGGQSIGVVGKPGLSEVLESTHLHFGLLKDSQGVNPLDYLPQ